MASAGNITAVLSLNARPFQEGLNSSTSAVTKFVESVNKLGSTNAKTGITQLNEQLNNLKTTLDRVSQTNNSSLNTFSKLATAINKMANGLKILQSDAINVEQAINTMNSIFQAFGNSLSGISVKLNGISVAEREVATATRTSTEAQLQAISSLNANRNAVMGLITGENQLSNAKKNVANASNQESAGIQRSNASMNQGVSSANRLTTATSRLGKAMSSLRMMGSLVGSMLAYNFAHKLLVATGETIHAKSEMEGYFKMLNFGQRDINSFNSALDKTVAQFQRVNKYSLGETISSIGVEFNLTTKEMEKAMKVTSMITSEYLRAGRNANEASLAVKDVLQGQFQRLSRETGVKGEQLKEAGWSGDTTDVLGLMEALEKVGKSRNWDVFAEKANSLNDILTITQNRFGEWSADLVYNIQPAIVGVFNMIMGTAQKLGGTLSGLWNWLNGDGIESHIAKWGLLATAIGTVLTAVISYRTGANLLQIAQMGLTGSISATVLGLEAETVAQYGTLTAIKSKMLGVEAEKVATLSTKDAILSKVLGLDAEVVAQEGLSSAIATSSFAREMEAMKLRGATEEEIANTLAIYENLIAEKSSLGLVSAQVMGLNMKTYATHGFTVALLEAKTGMDASRIASMGLAKKIALLGASMVVPSAIVGAFAIALGVLAYKMNESAKEMERFNDILKNGENTVKENRELVEQYTDRQAKLKEQLAQTEAGTTKYRQIQEQLRVTNQDLITSNKNVENSYLALQKAVSAQKHYEEAKSDMTIKKQGELADAYMKAGYSMKEAYEMANNSLIDAENGAEQLRQTLQKLAVIDYKGLQNANYLLAQFEESGVDKEVGKKYLEQSNTLHERMKKGMEKGMTDESFMGRLDGWLTYYQAQIENWINNVGAMLETNDWGKIWDNVWKGIAHGFADLPIIKDFWNWVFRETGLDQLKGKGLDGLFNTDNDLFTQYANNFVNGITQAFDGAKQTLTDWWNNFWSFDWLLGGVSASDGSSDHPSFMEDLSAIFGFDVQAWIDSFMADPMGTLGIDLSGFDIFGTLVNFLFGTGDVLDFSWATEWLNNNVIIPISETWNMFMSDPLSFIGGAVLGAGGIGGLLTLLLPSDGGVGIWEWVNTTIIQPMSQALWSGITSIPLVSDILALFGLVDGENSGSSQKGKDLGEAFKTAIEDKIRNIPILGDILQMLGVIPNANGDAHSKGHDVGENIKKGEESGHQGMADNIRGEMGNVINAISEKAGEAYAVAHDVGSRILNGIKDALDMHSPSIISRELISNEFGTYIPEAITSNGELAYQSAQYYGQQITAGISSVNTDSLGLDTAVGNYETDAQMIAMSSQMMGMETTTAFNDMSLAVNNTTATMSSNVGTTYSQMQQKQTSSLQSMKTQNQTAYNEMYLKSNQSLIQMRDSTTNITHQMINAWSHMKTQLVATANQLRSESTSHFNRLSETIGSFYRKIQNPSNWGAGTGSSTPVRSRRNTTAGRSFARGMRTRTSLHGAGTSSTYTGSKYMTIGSLKRKLCPDGSCDYLFNGMDSSERVNVEDFLASITGEHGFGGWSGWNTTHFNHIKNTSDQWDMKSPVIQVMGGIPTNAQFKVGDFENGTPSISFDSFKSMAESIFAPGGIPYKHYMDSAWKGSWLGAIQAGACNCSDGAEAIIAFASACGFGGGQKVHGYWGNEGHFWAVINGEVFDTTAMQKGYGWRSPSVHGYGTKVRTTVSSGDAPSNGNKTVNVTIDMSNSTIYGVDDLDSRIKTGVEEGLKEQFNDPYTVELI